MPSSGGQSRRSCGSWRALFAAPHVGGQCEALRRKGGGSGCCGRRAEASGVLGVTRAGPRNPVMSPAREKQYYAHVTPSGPGRWPALAAVDGLNASGDSRRPIATSLDTDSDGEQGAGHDEQTRGSSNIAQDLCYPAGSRRSGASVGGSHLSSPASCPSASCFRPTYAF